MADAMNLNDAAVGALDALSDPSIVTNYLGEKSRWQLEPRGNLSPIPGIGAAAPPSPSGSGAAQTGGTGRGGGGGSAATGGRGANILGAAEKALEALSKGAQLLPGETSGTGEPPAGSALSTPPPESLGEAGSGTPPPGSALSTPPPEALGTPAAIEGLGSGVLPAGSALSTPPPESLGEVGAGSSLSGGLGKGALGAGAVAAILGAIAEATGNKDLGTAAAALGDVAGGAELASSVGGVLSLTPAVGEAVAAAPTVAAAADLLGESVLGATGTAAGAAFAPVAAMLIATSIANLIKPGSAPELSDIWTEGGTDFKGVSKLTSAKRTEASRMWDQSQKTMQDALTAAEAAQKGGITDPAQLREIGDALMKGETSYYQTSPRDFGKIVGSGVGPSSYITGANRPDAMKPFNQGMQTWLALNKYLQDQGQPGLTISPDMIAATGITQPININEIREANPEFGVPEPQWGPMGPPPADLQSPEGQAWLNKAFLAYEQAGGMPTGTWAAAAPTPEQQQQQRAAQAAVTALGGGTSMGEIASGLDKNVMPAVA